MSRLQLAVYVSLMLLSAALAWHIQAWRFERQMALSDALQARERVEQVTALNHQLLSEQTQRQSLERRLQNSESTHFKELADAQQIQDRLRDRLATADLRLSVLVERDSACATLPAAASASGVDHDTVRLRLEPAHARRIIAITDRGDRGLIALRACQDYVRALTP